MKKLLAYLFAATLANVATPSADARKYTSSGGKPLEADVVAVRDGIASLKVASGKVFKVPLEALSQADQTYLKEWADENPSYGLNDLRFEIRKSHSIERKKTDDKKDKNKREKTSNIVWKGYLINNTRSTISDVKISYTIYKRVSSRGENGSSTDVEEIEDEANIGSLEAGEKYEFESTVVKELNKSQKATKDAKASSHRETVFGGHFSVSVKGKEISTFSDPRGFLERYDAAKKRDEDRDSR